MDVQGVLRWLVDAKIPVAKAMPLVSALATAGVQNAGDIASLDYEKLSAAVTDKSFLKKIRAKTSPSAPGARKEGKRRSGAGGSSDRKRVKPSSLEETRAAAAQHAPAPPGCSMSDAELSEVEVKINRSPVMVLWATEVAQRLSFDWSESVTIGRAVADWLALRKGEYLGVMEADEAAERTAREETEDLPTRTLEMMGQDFTLRQTEGGWRAISKGKLVPATRVHGFLCKAFGDKLGPVRAALRALAVAVPQHHVETTTRTMLLYESFRPAIPKGKAGWGQSGMLKLSRVMELRDELLREACVEARGARREK